MNNLGWTPITRELPEPNKQVLVCLADGNIEIDWIGMYDTGFVGHKRISREMDVAKAVAWMPLPKPYKEHSSREQGHHRGIAGGDRSMRNENGTVAAETLLVIIAVATLAIMIVR